MIFTLVKDNIDLLQSAASLRLEIESLIYTIERHRSLTGNRYVKARARFAAGLNTFFNDAVIFQPHPDSAIAVSDPTPSDPVNKKDVNCAIVPSEPHSDPPSIDGIEERALQSKPHIALHYKNTQDQVKNEEKQAKEKHFPYPASLWANEETFTTIKNQPSQPSQPSPITSTATNLDRAPVPLETNRSLWLPEVPGNVTLSDLCAQIYGGAIERVETFRHRRDNGYSVSLVFIESSAAQKYLSYVHTPQGKLAFPDTPSSWTYTVGWNSHPPISNYRVMNMALDPLIRARRCVIVKNFPIDFLDENQLLLRLRGLGGSFVTCPRVQRVVIEKELKEATILLERISCAVQLMESKITGKWGEEFESSTFGFGVDECERPFPPGTFEVQDETIAAERKDAITKNMDGQYEFYRASKDFQKMRSLYIPVLPMNFRLAELVAQVRGGPLERITLSKKENGMTAACITFVQHNSAKSWYEHVNSSAGRLKFPGVVWDWLVRWDTSVAPLQSDIRNSVMNPAVKARRCFIIKNLSRYHKHSAEALKADVMSQSNFEVLYEKFEVDIEKREGVVVMGSIGAAIRGAAVLRKMQKYKGCRIEFLKDECDAPIIVDDAITERKIISGPTDTSCPATPTKEANPEDKKVGNPVVAGNSTTVQGIVTEGGKIAPSSVVTCSPAILKVIEIEEDKTVHSAVVTSGPTVLNEINEEDKTVPSSVIAGSPTVPRENVAEEDQTAPSITTTCSPGILKEVSTEDKIEMALSPTNTSTPAQEPNITQTQGVPSQVQRKTLLISGLPASVTLDQLSKRIRGGALENMTIQACTEENATVLVTFLDALAAENYYKHFNAIPNTEMKASWSSGSSLEPTDPLSKDARRTLLVTGFPSQFDGKIIHVELEKIVKRFAYILKMDPKYALESICVRGAETKEARVIMASAALATRLKLELSRFWSVEFWQDECEGPLTELRLKV